VTVLSNIELAVILISFGFEYVEVEYVVVRGEVECEEVEFVEGSITIFIYVSHSSKSSVRTTNQNPPLKTDLLAAGGHLGC
jgi:hypothetical protein